MCQDLLRAVVPDYEDDRRKVICACLPYAEDRLREMLRSQRLRSVQEVLGRFNFDAEKFRELSARLASGAHTRAIGVRDRYARAVRTAPSLARHARVRDDST